MKPSIPITEERKLKVYNELCQGSDPRKAFFLLVAVSTLIAAFGLVMNSTAVVIGAMLVAPLMTPILGLGLGLVRGDPFLIGIAMRSEAIGVGISIVAAFIFGLMLPAYFEVTPEMLSRTQPSLLDLLVAVLAGFAGAYALIDEKLSPALPGVAISTAIVPPLANSGLCLAMGAYEGAVGSFLLFFTNFLSILLVSGIVFHAAGISQELHLKAGEKVLRRFGIALLGFIIVSSLLGIELFNMYETRQIEKQVKETLQKELNAFRINDLEKLVIEINDEDLEVRAIVNAPDVIVPRSISLLEERLAERTGKPTKLYIRTTLTHDVSAVGSINQYVAQTLDGISGTETQDERVTIMRTAEQLIREYLSDRRGLRLVKLKYSPLDSKILLIAVISGVRALALEEITELEALILDQIVQGKDVELAVLSDVSNLSDSQGGVRTQFSLPRLATTAETARTTRISGTARDWLESRTFWLHSWSVTILDDVYYLLLEVHGPRLFTAEDREAIQDELSRELNLPMEVYVRSQLETVVGPEGHIAFPELLNDFRKRNRAVYGDEIKRTIIESAQFISRYRG